MKTILIALLIAVFAFCAIAQDIESDYLLRNDAESDQADEILKGLDGFIAALKEKRDYKFSHKWDDEEESDVEESLKPRERRVRSVKGCKKPRRLLGGPCVLHPDYFNEEKCDQWKVEQMKKLAEYIQCLETKKTKQKKVKVAKKAEEKAETKADKFDLDKIFGYIEKGKNIYDLIKRKDDDDDDDQVASDSEISNGATLRATDSLNVRDQPCTSGRLLTTVAAGATVKYTGQTKSGCGYNWYAISGSFGNGWAAANWLQEVSTPPASGGDLTIQQLRAIMPRLPTDSYLGYLNSAMAQGNINTCARRSAFLAQLAHESGQLRWFEEFASGDAYEGRKTLGNIYPGDGRRYKGRGPIQLTGRANYRAAGQALGIDLEGNPTQAATPQVGFRIAVWFWNSRNLSSYADQNTQEAFDQITRRVNGGFNGKADRDGYWRKAKSVLGC